MCANHTAKICRLICTFAEIALTLNRFTCSVSQIDKLCPSQVNAPPNAKFCLNSV